MAEPARTVAPFHSPCPIASLISLTSEDGQIHTTITPIELGWMHNVQPALSYGDEGKIDAAHVRVAKEILMFGRNGVYFRHVRMRADDGNILSAAFRIRISLPGTTLAEERAFRLVSDATQHLLLRAERDEA